MRLESGLMHTKNLYSNSSNYDNSTISSDTIDRAAAKRRRRKRTLQAALVRCQSSRVLTTTTKTTVYHHHLMRAVHPRCHHYDVIIYKLLLYLVVTVMISNICTVLFLSCSLHICLFVVTMSGVSSLMSSSLSRHREQTQQRKRKRDYKYDYDNASLHRYCDDITQYYTSVMARLLHDDFNTCKNSRSRSERKAIHDSCTHNVQSLHGVDFRLHVPFTCLISGKSQCGKTELLLTILSQWRYVTSDHSGMYTKTLYWFYGSASDDQMSRVQDI